MVISSSKNITRPLTALCAPNNSTCIGFYRLNQVLELIPIGKSTWWAWVAAGRAPAPVKLSQSVTAWRKEEVHTLIEKLANKGSPRGNGGENV